MYDRGVKFATTTTRRLLSNVGEASVKTIVTVFVFGRCRSAGVPRATIVPEGIIAPEFYLYRSFFWPLSARSISTNPVRVSAGYGGRRFVRTTSKSRIEPNAIFIFAPYRFNFRSSSCRLCVIPDDNDKNVYDNEIK